MMDNQKPLNLPDSEEKGLIFSESGPTHRMDESC